MAGSRGAFLTMEISFCGRQCSWYRRGRPPKTAARRKEIRERGKKKGRIMQKGGSGHTFETSIKIPICGGVNVFRVRLSAHNNYRAVCLGAEAYSRTCRLIARNGRVPTFERTCFSLGMAQFRGKNARFRGQPRGGGEERGVEEWAESQG